MSGYVLTGSNGFIGNAFLRYLLDKKENVLVILRKDSPNYIKKIESPYISYLTYDINSYDDEILESEYADKYDTFVSFGWCANRNKVNDTLSQANSVIFTLKGARFAANVLKCKKIVGIGSQAEYGINKGTITEDTITTPTYPYGICKLTTYNLLKLECEKLKVKFNWIRICSIYGYGDHDTTLISLLISSIMNKKEIKLSSCNQIWNFLYIDDAVSGIYSISKNGKEGEIYNLANFENQKLKDYVNTIVDIFDQNYHVVFDEEKIGKELNVDMSKVKRDIPWAPKVKFIDGIRKMKELYISEEVK